MAMLSYDDYLDHEFESDRRAYAEEAGEEAAYLEQRARWDARDEAQVSDLEYIEQGLTEKARDLEQRMSAARELVHTALLAADAGNGLGLLKISSLLASALAELGCKDCGQKIPVGHLQQYVYCRGKCKCAHECTGGQS